MKMKYFSSFFSLVLLLGVQSAQSVDAPVTMPKLQNPKSAESVAAYVATTKELLAALPAMPNFSRDVEISYVDLDSNRSALAEVAMIISSWDQDKDSPICQLSDYIADGYNVAPKDAVLDSLAYAQMIVNKSFSHEQREEVDVALNEIINQIVGDQLAIDAESARALATPVIKLREKLYLFETAKFFKDVEFKNHVTFEKSVKFKENVTIDGTLSAADAVIGCDLFVGCNINMHNSSDAAIGNIVKDGLPFIHNFGSENTFVGINAGNFTMTGSSNTGNGAFALISNTTGTFDTAMGAGALGLNQGGNVNTANGAASLISNTLGGANTAVGFISMASNVSGNGNTAVGIAALVNNSIGGGNTALGAGALDSNISGNDNIGIGPNAGTNLLNGNNNIYIANAGANESGAIRIGSLGTHTSCFVQGINTVTVAGAVPVVIGASGQLGTVVSARRFKHNIVPMASDSEVIYQLNPVTFAYNQDASETKQYGLIAEEVDLVFPAIVIKDEDGNPYTVQYQVLPVLLLNELIKQKAEFSSAIENLSVAIDNMNNRLMMVEGQN